MREQRMNSGKQGEDYEDIYVKNKFQTNATLVANDFIDHYMVQANGEFVKVYLFLLRHLDNAGSSLTVSAVADCLNNTENDILRAFKYWESKGLLQMECDAEGHVCELELIQIPRPKHRYRSLRPKSLPHRSSLSSLLLPKLWQLLFPARRRTQMPQRRKSS